MTRRAELTFIDLPVTDLLEENPLPMFSSARDRTFRDGGLLPVERDGLGENTGFRILPYRLQDRYAPHAQRRAVSAAVLENDRLRAAFLPEYGGRLYSLWDKRRERECLYINPGIQLRNLALRNAWFSGGVEWNFGHFGHTCLTRDQVVFAACTDESGERFLRMYEFERCKQVTFQVDFHLPEGADALTAHISLYNRTHEAAPVFLWTNTALPEEPGMHVYSGTREVVAQRVSNDAGKSFFFHAQLPGVYRSGQDASDPTVLTSSTEYFFQNPPTEETAFEAVWYPDGRLFAERSTQNMPYRKLFCWGNHRGGKHWQRYLACGGAGGYVEAQAGTARTQVHPTWLSAQSALHITQQFILSDSPAPCSEDYGQARAEAASRVEALLPKADLLKMHERCEALSTQKAEALLFHGSGWGALELRRDAAALPEHLAFPDETLSEKQEPWLGLLEGRAMNRCDSFMVAQPWLERMERAAPKTAALWTQLGVALCEQGRTEDAARAWEQALLLERQPLALRNLAWLARRQGNDDLALESMREALGLLGEGNESRPYAEETLELLTDAGRYEEAFAFYRQLPQSLRLGERLRLLAMRSACRVGEDAFLEAQFNGEFTTVREGELSLNEPWNLFRAGRRAKESGMPITDELLRETAALEEIPEHLDFRMALD